MGDKKIEILLVEDNPGDVRLMMEAFREMTAHYHINVVGNGEDALKYLYQEDKYTDVPRPNLIILDLNLPKKDGREVLEVIKSDKDKKYIPVVILSTSNAEEDIIKTYNLHANCYITKPVDLEQFMALMKSFEDFWLTIVTLPEDEMRAGSSQ